MEYVLLVVVEKTTTTKIKINFRNTYIVHMRQVISERRRYIAYLTLVRNLIITLI